MKPQGFTLLEMVVLLLIMVAIASFAYSSVSLEDDREKQGESELALETVNKALIGTGDGTSLSAGFCADMGRMPQQLGNDPALHLRELLVGTGLPAFQIKAIIVNGKADTISYGWRGPYIKLRLGKTGIVDGWGTPFGFEYDQNGRMTAIVSYGADTRRGEIPNDPYSRDTAIAFPTCIVSGAVKGQNSGLPVVALFAYDYVNNVVKAPVTYTFKPADVSSDGKTYAFNFPNQTPGTKWIYASQAGKTAQVKIAVQPGGLPNVAITVK